MTPQENWAQLEKELKSAVSSLDQRAVRVLIPGWDPVDLTMGKRWARSQIFEGYYVRFRCVGRDVHFETWECRESEPGFA